MKPKPQEELQMDRFAGTYFLLVFYKEGCLKVSVKQPKWSIVHTCLKVKYPGSPNWNTEEWEVLHKLD
jgi:hypothetical protein